MRKITLGVLISGSGTNLQAIIDECESGEFPAEVGVVISSREDAYGLDRAKSRKIRHFWVDRAGFDTNEDFDLDIAKKLQDCDVDLVVLAGYMRLVGPAILDAYPNAVINLHPSLLPAFPGGNAVSDALEYGTKVTGITVHFADSTYDTGPIILQEIVPVHQEDDEEALFRRIHKTEHRFLPYAIKLWATGRLKVEGRRVTILPAT
ncbi:MAG TPA: phosphoribosylglycinamide formyltransferase [Actinobacteria bacterium]|nr:phosphoribosylglycinamide formyltransferase [Actinomycetota bacterium]